MSKFRVTIAQDCTESGVVIVEADSTDEAEDKALDQECWPDDFEFIREANNDYSKSRYVASYEILPEENVELNQGRADLGLIAVEAMSTAVGSGNDLDEAISDCLSDIMHLARNEGMNAADLVRRATNNFNEEVLGIDDA